MKKKEKMKSLCVWQKNWQRNAVCKTLERKSI